MRNVPLLGLTAIAGCGLSGLVHAACVTTPAGGGLPLVVTCDPEEGETISLTEGGRLAGAGRTTRKA